MNVGLFSDCYRPAVSGVVTSMRQLKEGLERRDHRVVVVTVATPGHDEGDAAVYGFPSIPFQGDSGWRLGLARQGAVERIVREERLDVVHTHTEYSLGWAGRRAARRLGLPLVHTAHTMHEAYRHYLPLGRLVSRSLVQHYLRRFLSGYDALVCPSQKARVYFRSLLPTLLAVQIGNGLCPSRFRPGALSAEERARLRRSLGIPNGARVVLYAGRLGREKRVLELLAALAPLLRQERQLRALFVGGGPALGPLARAAARDGLDGQVILTGTADWEQMHRFYSIADLFTTASLSEIQPMTLIEALACGLPIVARRDESYVDLVVDGYNGYLADSDRQVADHAAEILGDEARRLAFSRNALSLSAGFGADAHAAKLESLYESVVQ